MEEARALPQRWCLVSVSDEKGLTELVQTLLSKGWGVDLDYRHETTWACLDTDISQQCVRLVPEALTTEYLRKALGSVECDHEGRSYDLVVVNVARHRTQEVLDSATHARLSILIAAVFANTKAIVWTNHSQYQPFTGWPPKAIRQNCQHAAIKMVQQHMLEPIRPKIAALPTSAPCCSLSSVPDEEPCMTTTFDCVHGDESAAHGRLIRCLWPSYDAFQRQVAGSNAVVTVFVGDQLVAGAFSYASGIPETVYADLMRCDPSLPPATSLNDCSIMGQAWLLCPKVETDGTVLVTAMFNMAFDASVAHLWEKGSQVDVVCAPAYTGAALYMMRNQGKLSMYVMERQTTHSPVRLADFGVVTPAVDISPLWEPALRQTVAWVCSFATQELQRGYWMCEPHRFTFQTEPLPLRRNCAVVVTNVESTEAEQQLSTELRKRSASAVAPFVDIVYLTKT